jgi:hypothetical protein
MIPFPSVSSLSANSSLPLPSEKIDTVQFFRHVIRVRPIGMEHSGSSSPDGLALFFWAEESLPVRGIRRPSAADHIALLDDLTESLSGRWQVI